MQRATRGRAYRRLGASLLCVLQLAGCATWQPSRTSPRELIENQRPRSVRVRAAGGTPIVVHQPRVEGSSIVFTDQCRRVDAFSERYVCPTREVMPLEDVRLTEVRRVSLPRTAALALTVVTLVSWAAWDSAWSDWGSGW